MWMKADRPLKVVFFKTAIGNEPVREWLKAMSKEASKTIGADILTVQYAWPVGKPLVDNLGDGIWEVRSRLDITALRGPCSQWWIRKLSCCTVSSRNSKRRHRMNWNWRRNAKSNICYEQKNSSRQ
jgi:hypothetical protein